jgi:hypothetical protein
VKEAFDRGETAPGAVVTTVTLREGEQYGAKVYKPGCRLSEGFAHIAGTKTITPHTIMWIKAMGFTVKVEGKPEVTL